MFPELLLGEDVLPPQLRMRSYPIRGNLGIAPLIAYLPTLLEALLIKRALWVASWPGGYCTCAAQSAEWIEQHSEPLATPGDGPVAKMGERERRCMLCGGRTRCNSDRCRILITHSPHPMNYDRLDLEAYAAKIFPPIKTEDVPPGETKMADAPQALQDHAKFSGYTLRPDATKYPGNLPPNSSEVGNIKRIKFEGVLRQGVAEPPARPVGVDEDGPKHPIDYALYAMAEISKRTAPMGYDSEHPAVNALALEARKRLEAYVEGLAQETLSARRIILGKGTPMKRNVVGKYVPCDKDDSAAVGQLANDLHVDEITINAPSAGFSEYVEYYEESRNFTAEDWNQIFQRMRRGEWEGVKP